MRQLNVLIACEESQTVCKEFRKLGHNAYSCDIQKAGGGHPEWHILGDCLPIINGHCRFFLETGQMVVMDGNWDLIIAHPPCTYLTKAGAVQLFRDEKKVYLPYGEFQMVNVERLKKGIAAKDFFMKIYNCNCKHIVIENPIPMAIFTMPKESQIIQPYEFGDTYSKKTYLWIKGLPNLQPTKIVKDYQPLINGGGGRLKRFRYEGKKFAGGSKKRSKTFKGIAKAMANQWSDFILSGKPIEQQLNIFNIF